tara:strand:+ start:138 stop:377 length:240 start_codon:yes stop_codon:yes gene_type:complete
MNKMSILSLSKEELVDLLNASETQNDEMLELMYKVALAFGIEIQNPFDSEITYEVFINEFKIKMINRVEHYNELRQSIS